MGGIEGIGVNGIDRNGRRAASDRAEQAKAQALQLIRKGYSYQDAMVEVGRQPNTWFQWMNKSPKFRDQAIAAKAAWDRQQSKASLTWRERQDEFEPIMLANYKNRVEYWVAFRKAYFGFDTFDHQWEILEAWDAVPAAGISLVLVPPEAGKALALDTPIPTPTGFKTMGALRVGDAVFGAHGKPCKVTHVSKVFTDHRCFEVVADDGSAVVADADHLWPVRVSQDKSSGSRTRRGWKASVKIKTTLDLATKRAKRPMLQMNWPLDLPEMPLPIDPYVLGVWLGDGSSAGGRIYSADEDAVVIRERFRQAGYESRDLPNIAWSVPGLQTKLRALGVLNNKHIPIAYLRASTAQRTALLQGLVDTDGFVAPNGMVEFTSTNAALASGTLGLVRSLGVKAGLAESRATLNGRDISAKYRVTFFKADAAYLPRKRAQCKDGTRRPNRYLEAREVPSVPTRCIVVDAPDHLFLAGEGYLVTHNSTLLCDTVTADLCDNANRRRAIVSEGKDLASKMMGRVARRLEDNAGPPSLLQQHFGPFQPGPGDSRKWNATEFTLLASDHDEADPSFLSVGAGSNIRGVRWDDVDLDDIQSIKSKNKTNTLLEIIRGDIIPRVKRGRIRMTGSRVCKGDVYDEGIRLDLFDEVIVIPALDMKKPLGSRSYFPLQFRKEMAGEKEIDVPIVDEHGEQLGFSDAELLQRAGKLGDDLWSRIYMMKPQSEHESLVTDEDLLKATDTGQPGHPKRYMGQHPAGSVATICSMDPSLHKHAALGADGYNAEFLYVITTVDLYKATTNQRIFAEMRALSKKYLPTWWVIENNTLQSGYLTDDPFLELVSEFGFNAVGHHTGDNKQDQYLGIPAMMAAICRGEIRFPMIENPDNLEGRALAKLFQQLKDWRQDVPTKQFEQDQVMRLWFSYLLWKKLREQVEVDTSQWKRNGLTSVSDYPYAKTNVMPARTAATVREHKTYDQHWAELTESV